MVMMADLSPASIFSTPSPYEKSSIPDEPETLKSTTTSSSKILDKCTFILTDGAVLGPLELIVQSSTIGSSTKLLSGLLTPIVLTESIILLLKLTLKPSRDVIFILLEMTSIFRSTHRVAI